jgi:MFS family permease
MRCATGRAEDMSGFLGPQDAIDEPQTRRGLWMLLMDGVFAYVMGSLTGGAFLVAFAILLGANNTVIGLLAAIGPFAQILQIPAIALVNRTQRRKMLTVVAVIVSRSLWVFIAVLPWLLPPEARLAAFLAALMLYFALNSVAGCAWNSWMRDFVPEPVMGSFFGKRMAIGTALAAALSLGAGLAISPLKGGVHEGLGYCILFLAGTGGGLAGMYFLARVPEPRMAEPPPGQKLSATLAEPLRDPNYRQLLWFLGTWNFAVNLAGPFFVVYMLNRLKLSMAWVMSLAVLSQLANVVFFRIWGRLADRFTNKSVLAVTGPMFIISILLWVFTTMPEPHVLTIPLLIGIHALAGMSTAGVALCAGNLALKAAPRGKATAYLATNALVSGLAATAAPLLAGFAADWFASQRLDLTLQWSYTGTPARGFDLPAISLQGLDFLFILSFLCGLYSLHRLLAIKEAGEVGEKVVLTEMYAEVRRTARHVSNVAGLRQLFSFPYYLLRALSFGATRPPKPPANPPAAD